MSSKIVERINLGNDTRAFFHAALSRPLFDPVVLFRKYQNVRCPTVEQRAREYGLFVVQHTYTEYMLLVTHLDLMNSSTAQSSAGPIVINRPRIRHTYWTRSGQTGWPAWAEMWIPHDSAKPRPESQHLFYRLRFARIGVSCM